MKRIQINDQNKFNLLIIAVLVFALWNMISLISTKNLIALLPISIQLFLITILYFKTWYSKIAVQIWISVFLILSNLLIVIGALLIDIGNWMQGGDGNWGNTLSTKSLFSFGMLIIAYFVWDMQKSAFEVVESEEKN